MGDNQFSWSEKLSYGVTGDLCQNLTRIARAFAEANPHSIYSYSAWRVCQELNSYYTDDQGIPVEDAMVINKFVEGPLKRMLEANGLRVETAASTSALSDLIQALHMLRKERLSFR